MSWFSAHQPYNPTFDIRKLVRAIESGTISFPKGLRGGRQQFLRDAMHEHLDPSKYHAAECVRGLLL